ncbi:TIGR01777 family oxidoreductase [Bacillus sp. 2205SS5-2]|uniref:TIGR01777 family oxidoreductase n=1 Tax=Bacillus sp. 2205SS5-2 TaxID=3109031 RepID=UPI0030049AA8
MKIAITGGTGFVGNHLVDLLKKNHQLYVLTRNPEKHHQPNVTYVKWLTADSQPELELAGIDAVINLASESINSGRWTETRKKRIQHSRSEATQAVFSIMNALPDPPKILINASAIGYYHASKTITHKEESKHTGSDFLAKTVIEWEQEAKKAEELGVRVVITRFGIILGKEDGALPRMVLPYKLFAGGPVGSGEQWMSWVHIKDVCSAIEFLLHHDITGPVNIVSPNPVTMKEFGSILGKVLHRPHWLPVPSFIIKAALGEMSTLILDGQKVSPSVLEKTGYAFSFPLLSTALKDLYS